MKKLLLVGLLLAATGTAQAQGMLYALGGSLTMAIVETWQQDSRRFVTMAHYQQRDYAQKRTPPVKLSGKGSTQIMHVEKLLAGYDAVMRSDSLALLIPPAQVADYVVARNSLLSALPRWSMEAYDNEMEFYVYVNQQRQAKRDALLQRLLREAQLAARQDSLQRAAVSKAASKTAMPRK